MRTRINGLLLTDVSGRSPHGLPLDSSRPLSDARQWVAWLAGEAESPPKGACRHRILEYTPDVPQAQPFWATAWYLW
jgi:hypothetical protein